MIGDSKNFIQLVCKDNVTKGLWMGQRHHLVVLELWGATCPLFLSITMPPKSNQVGNNKVVNTYGPNLKSFLKSPSNIKLEYLKDSFKRKSKCQNRWKTIICVLPERQNPRQKKEKFKITLTEASTVLKNIS